MLVHIFEQQQNRKEEIHINNPKTIQEVQSQRTVQIDEYTVIETFLGKTTFQKCMEEVVKWHIENDSD